MGLMKKLFKPRWMSESDWIAKDAVIRINDPETLRCIVAEAPSVEARVDALKKLNDQALYREVAMTSEDADLAYRAAMNVDDLSTLESFLERGLLDTSPMERRNVLVRLLSIRKNELNAINDALPTTDDAARIIDLAVSDPEQDAPQWPRHDRKADPYRSMKFSADLLRHAAVRRLAELGDDGALAEVIKRAADDKVMELAVSLVQDKSVLDRLILDGNLRSEAQVCVISHMDNAELLRELLGKVDPLAAKSTVFAYRLMDLPCIDGQYHEWVTISEEDNSALGAYSEGPHTIDWERRCSKCGLEVKGCS